MALKSIKMPFDLSCPIEQGMQSVCISCQRKISHGIFINTTTFQTFSGEFHGLLKNHDI